VCRSECLLVALAAVTLGAAAEGQALRPGDPDAVVAEWRFDAGDLGGWHATHNLTPLEVVDGVLRTRATGPDANMAVAPDVDAADVSHLVVRMRSSQAGMCQIYFATSEHGDPAQNDVPVFACPVDREFREYSVRLAGCRGWSGRVGVLRIDPVNGGGESADIELDWIRLIRQAPRLTIDSFAADDPWVSPGDEVTLRLALRSVGGACELSGLRAELEGEGGLGAAVGVVPETTEPAPGVSRQQFVARWAVRAPRGVGHRYDAVVRLGDSVVARAQCWVVTSDATTLMRGTPGPGLHVERTGWTLCSGDAVLHVLRDSEGRAVAGVLRVLVGDEVGRIIGLCSPLVTVAVEEAGCPALLAQALEGDVRGGRLALSADVPGGRVTLALRPGHESRIDARARLAASRALGVLRFSGPTLLAGEGAYEDTKEEALFPGIEYLGPGQRSSDTLSVGTTVGFRPSPAPYQITVPLMAVAEGATLCGVMWDALQPWAEGQALPMAEFASPNFLDGQANHAMAVFVPNTSRGMSPNERLATAPLVLGPGGELSIGTTLFAVAGGSMIDAVPLWYDTYGQPAPPETAKPLDEVLDDLMRGWAETCYDRASDGFVNHWRVGQTPAPSRDLKAALLTHFLRTGERRWVERCGIPNGAAYLDLLGSFIAPFEIGPPPNVIGEQAADGTFAYHCTDDVRQRCIEFTGGARTDLGEEGSTCVGLCAVKASPILSHAIRTGDERSVAAGLKALEGMKRFTVPAGSQTWEVHKDIPDIYAAAVATDCYHMGYELTGDEDYLERARYWAYSGLPFLYAYRVPGTGPGATCNVPGDPLTEGDDPFQGPHPAAEVFGDPDRQVTPYGSIPVFGTSFYRVTWFGNLVQWCGLVWAGSVYALLEHGDDAVLRTAADGVVASGANQTFDRPPVVGLLPDTWHLGPNVIHPAFIGPVRLEQPLRQQLDDPSYSGEGAYVVRGEGRRAHIISRATVESGELAGTSLRWTARYPAGQVWEAAVIGIALPREVRVAGQALRRVDDIGATMAGYSVDAATGAVLIRASAAGSTVKVEVRW